MGVEELLYLCCYFHMSRMALGDRFAYINQHCGPLFSGLFGLLMGGERSCSTCKSSVHDYM